MQDLTTEILTQYIGGSVSWPDRKTEPVVSWRSGQVNLGFSLKKGVGENWSIHEALRDLKSETFRDTQDMRNCFGDLDRAVAGFAREHWEVTEVIEKDSTMGKVQERHGSVRFGGGNRAHGSVHTVRFLLTIRFRRFARFVL